jgi:branched-subunit amino acid ABC-type transport system permease component
MIFIQFLNGLSTAMLLFLLASGLTLIFGVLRVINFAHGSLYMLGAYFTYSIATLSGNYWLSLVVAPLCVAVAAAIIELLFLRRLYAREHEFQLLLLFGFVLVLDDVVKACWGTALKLVPKPAALDGSVQILGRTFPEYTVLIIVLGPLVALGLWYALARTRIGKQIVAASLDRDAANALGMNVPFLYTTVFVFGAWLGGLGGAVAAPLRAASPGMGMEIVIMSFAVVIIGGLGSIWGAFLGSILIGEVLAFGTLVVPKFVVVLPFAFMILVFLWRPQGLFGKGGV